MELIDAAEDALEAACHARLARDRYVNALRAALRAATALVTARRSRTAAVAPRSVDAAPRSVWELLAVSAPELAEWADFFAFSAARRAHLDAPVATVSARSADDLVRAARTFVDLVGEALGLPRVARPARLVPLTR